MANFEQARLKIERAEHLIFGLNSLIESVQKSDVATIEINPEFGNEVIKHDLPNGGSRNTIALIAGDCFHNLKCSLDYSWIEILTKFVPQRLGSKSKFPVFPTRDAVEAALRSIAIDQAAPKVFDEMLTKIQPYAQGDFAIWPIHRFNIQDKHRLLIPTILYGSVSGIVTEDRMGLISHDGFTAGTQQLPPWYIPMPLGTHVKNPGKVAVTVSLEEGKIGGGEIIFADTLHMYAQHFHRIVEMLEALV